MRSLYNDKIKVEMEDCRVWSCPALKMAKEVEGTYQSVYVPRKFAVSQQHCSRGIARLSALDFGRGLA